MYGCAAVSGGDLIAAWDLADAQAAPGIGAMTALLEVKGIAEVLSRAARV